MSELSEPQHELSRRQAILLGGGVLAALAVSGPTSAQQPSPSDSITQLRNATLLIHYGGVRFLVDPMLGDVGTYPAAPGSASSHLRNPLAPLPVPVGEIVDVDAVIVTHLHADHWDDAAKAQLPKSMPIFSQNEEDAAKIRLDGFQDVRLLAETSEFRGVTLSKTRGQHGTDAAMQVIGDRMGKVSGVVFSMPGRKTVYVAGDTVWNEFVREAIGKHTPDIIVVNAGNALFLGLDPIIMGTADVLAVHQAAPQALLVASHMEALNHCILSRADLRAFAEKSGFSASLQIPQDGETIPI